jgi:hypothetical protein
MGIDQLIKTPLFIIGAVTFFFVHWQQKVLKRRPVAPARFSSSFYSLITMRFAVRCFMDFDAGWVPQKYVDTLQVRLKSDNATDCIHAPRSKPDVLFSNSLSIYRLENAWDKSCSVNFMRNTLSRQSYGFENHWIEGILMPFRLIVKTLGLIWIYLYTGNSCLSILYVFSHKIIKRY